MKIKNQELNPDLVIRTKDEHNKYLVQLEKNRPVPILSILIATTKDRRFMFNNLCQEFYRQIDLAGLAGKGLEEWYVKVTGVNTDGTESEAIAHARYTHGSLVELIFKEDNKEMSIGEKRQLLLEQAKGEYIVFFDSDDFPKDNYVTSIVKAIEQKPDCIGFKIAMLTNGKNPQTCCHSLKYKQWKNNTDGFDYVRSVTIFNPVKRDLALQVGFKSIRYGEDKDYSDRLTPICNKEIYLNDFLFEYRYSTAIPHAEKYGIK
jgi:hypothetical protein